MRHHRIVFFLVVCGYVTSNTVADLPGVLGADWYLRCVHVHIRRCHPRYLYRAFAQHRSQGRGGEAFA